MQLDLIVFSIILNIKYKKIKIKHNDHKDKRISVIAFDLYDVQINLLILMIIYGLLSI
jgi:hypothetical protein